ncbi:hypothetical protein [Parasphingorhabdus sp.]|uniref:hypothetical protein n=1 Tax=Parasphingorhabdus sp. TaxID=2709688 RepID=UPI002F9512EE
MKNNAPTDWRKGYGVIKHSPTTITRVDQLLAKKQILRGVTDVSQAHALIAAADRLANAAMWLTAHMTYAARVDLNGADLPVEAFKQNPEGHIQRRHIGCIWHVVRQPLHMGACRRLGSKLTQNRP